MLRINWTVETSEGTESLTIDIEEITKKYKFTNG